MYEEFKRLLPDATGRSELVIVANADIRGFSKFSLEVESVEAAIFIRKVYERLLDEYFADASFFKPTGDGLLLVFVLEEKTLPEIANSVISNSLRLIDDFPTLLDDDPLINFPVPRAIGVGLARGAASRLVSGDVTLDYSGKVLNLASRLMDFARPSGVVLDASFGIDLLEDNLAKQFSEDAIFVRSVAERKPLNVYFTAEHTIIPATSRRPLDTPDWHTQRKQMKFKDFEELNTNSYLLVLERRPVDQELISVSAVHPNVTASGRRGKMFMRPSVKFRYELLAGKPFVAIDARELKQRLDKSGVKAQWDVALEIVYPV